MVFLVYIYLYIYKLVAPLLCGAQLDLLSAGWLRADSRTIMSGAGPSPATAACWRHVGGAVVAAAAVGGAGGGGVRGGAEGLVEDPSSCGATREPPAAAAGGGPLQQPA